MDKFTTHEYAMLNEALDGIAVASANILQLAERSYAAIRISLQNLKVFILSYTFKDRQEEVLFFKEIKPQFLKELIYYRKIFYIEAGKPLGDKEALRAYYKQETARINLFIERNHSFYIYYRMGKATGTNNILSVWQTEPDRCRNIPWTLTLNSARYIV